MVELSKVDQKLDSFKPEIAEITKRVEDAKDNLNKALEKKDNLVSFIEENRAKIVSYEEKITETKNELDHILKKNAKAKNEKEVSAASSEELIARDRLKFANEEIDRLNQIIDVKEQELKELEEQIAEIEKEYAQVQEQSAIDFEKINEQKQEFIKQREETTKGMGQKILSFYERIRAWAGNTAVVKVENQACYGCYMKINDKVYSDLILGEDIVTCPHCGRVLYIEDKKEEAEAS